MPSSTRTVGRLPIAELHLAGSFSLSSERRSSSRCRTLRQWDLGQRSLNAAAAEWPPPAVSSIEAQHLPPQGAHTDPDNEVEEHEDKPEFVPILQRHVAA
eukprot:CAMPEP_0177189658 /NCGR_PEP_ID=MMETSP0367-20130122/20390_1 /TAXON_ID=447022 ORGANISM="Scrippsiella hangoei-like, Strain SHHI-4" /NCGR_SAMPLE_ID=MMETSP0367 /ASSEMBLY_ACC=CAM_ASM_000362 /LENGTH=99 /DNA_ID=CAMNT_0018637219 /DNA_START=136 /DNA_END=435 /DNA_ORIENTATION=-